jgi:hypothetical protein
MRKVRYNHRLNGDDQVDMEETIAAIIFDHADVELKDDDTAADLGRNILYVVLRQFRPDFFIHTEARSRR